MTHGKLQKRETAALVITVFLVLCLIGVRLYSDEEGTFTMAAHVSGESRWQVDINTADAETLKALPGIGPALAENIIAYREEHGGFDAVEELMEVSGIGKETFAALEAYITV